MRRAFYIARLIEKSLRGALSGEEGERLEEWRSEAPENERAFRRMTVEGFYEEGMARWGRFDGRVAFGRWLQRKEERARARRAWRRGLRVAAAVLPLVLAVTLWFEAGREMERPLRAEAVRILPGTSRATLTLGDGRTVALGGTGTDGLIETDGVRISASASGVAYEVKGGGKPATNRLEIPRGGEFCLALSDGTMVWLNSETAIEYPAAFGEEERRVRVSGEAYFEVARDSARPFRVEFAGAEVTVLGTSFNVRAYGDEGVSATTLAEGLVSLRTKAGVMRLRPGEQARVDAATGVTEKREVDAAVYTSWRRGRFVFARQPLADIMRTLERWYDIRVIFKEEAAKRVSLSGNLRRYDDFSRVVEMLEMTGGVKFEVMGRDVYISME